MKKLRAIANGNVAEYDDEQADALLKTKLFEEMADAPTAINKDTANDLRAQWQGKGKRTK